jgi:hypothetical protein
LRALDVRRRRAHAQFGQAAPDLRWADVASPASASDRAGFPVSARRSELPVAFMSILRAAVLAGALAGPGPASAEITVAVARITEGALWVIGQVDQPEAEVTLDGAFTEKAERRGYFRFRVIHHLQLHREGDERDGIAGGGGGRLRAGRTAGRSRACRPGRASGGARGERRSRPRRPAGSSRSARPPGATRTGGAAGAGGACRAAGPRARSASARPVASGRNAGRRVTPPIPPPPCRRARIRPAHRRPRARAA